MIPGSPELVGLDTNVILRAVLQDDPGQAPAAAALMRSLNAQRRGFITSATLAEVYWVLSRTVRLPRADSLGVISRLIHSEALEFDDNEGVVRALHFAQQGADFADALIHETMQQFGVTETVTFDRRAAGRLGWRLLA